MEFSSEGLIHVVVLEVTVHQLQTVLRGDCLGLNRVVRAGQGTAIADCLKELMQQMRKFIQACCWVISKARYRMSD